MNILVIGNGFDLAHGLPTKYGDFLEFVKVIRQVVKIHDKESLDSIKWENINLYIKEIIEKNMGNVRNNLLSQKQMWDDILEDNFWIDYFLQCDMYQKENWIDFESEISRIIRNIDNDMRGKDFYGQINGLTIKHLEDYYLHKGFKINKFGEWEGIREITYQELRNSLLKDLNRLIRALEIYLCEFVEKVYIQKKSPDIEELEVDYILSFNYTHIFSTIYEISERSRREVENPFDYIHGEATLNNTMETDTMVLGIDEYLSKKKRNKEIEFITFKKYYQRIHKGTGYKYKDWLDVIDRGKKEILEKLRLKNSTRIPFNSYGNKRHYVYFFGHSLDVTDKDILRDLILNDNVYTTIFYHKTYDDNGKDDNGRSDLGSKIANLVKVIGQDELIRRTGGSTKTIEFKLQQDMEPIRKQQDKEDNK